MDKIDVYFSACFIVHFLDDTLRGVEKTFFVSSLRLRQLEFPFLIGGRLGFQTIFVEKKRRKKP